MLEMDLAPPLHEVLVLYTTKDKYFITPANNSEVLIIDRVTEHVSIEANTDQVVGAESRQEIYGVVGAIRLIAGLYLIVVTGRIKIGLINRQPVFRALAFSLLPLPRSKSHLNEVQLELEKEYVSMVNNVLALPHFYFSYTYDLSHSTQRLHNTSPDFLEVCMFQRAEKRFVWNCFLLEELFQLNNGVGQYGLPLILGFVSINSCVLNGKSFTYTLVSRRSRERAGTRLFTRGVDIDGNVANFVETEQIVETSTDLASFLQTRGSIPLFWTQAPNLTLKPKPRILETENHTDAFIKHFNRQIDLYGKQVIVNLVNHHGAEGNLETCYKQIFDTVNNPNIRYEAFDFHKECGKMKYERLKILADRLALDQETLGVFLQMGDTTVISLQKGVFRTNCVDCLDRTNVVQSVLARNSLSYVLRKLSILRRGEKVEGASGLEVLFRSVWADHADAISVQYSGTGALKTDFTRTGRRSAHGVFNDGVNSLLRYYKNNFKHGNLQDSFDLFLGQYRVQQGEGVTFLSPLQKTKGWKYLIVPMVLLVAIAMFFANAVTPPEYTTGTLLCLLFWGSMVGLTLSSILYYGSEFVDVPVLCLPPHGSSEIGATRQAGAA